MLSSFFLEEMLLLLAPRLGCTSNAELKKETALTIKAPIENIPYKKSNILHAYNFIYYFISIQFIFTNNQWVGLYNIDLLSYYRAVHIYNILII